MKELRGAQAHRRHKETASSGATSSSIGGMNRSDTAFPEQCKFAETFDLNSHISEKVEVPSQTLFHAGRQRSITKYEKEEKRQVYIISTTAKSFSV